jgi:hypothetical protein
MHPSMLNVTAAESALALAEDERAKGLGTYRATHVDQAREWLERRLSFLNHYRVKHACSACARTTTAWHRVEAYRYVCDACKKDEST